ncbi:hypothetical protein JOE09_004050 [Pantoea coffeiphila]|nr:hypothetical protein [Pantoea coffeiphila]
MCHKRKNQPNKLILNKIYIIKFCFNYIRKLIINFGYIDINDSEKQDMHLSQ